MLLNGSWSVVITAWNPVNTGAQSICAPSPQDTGEACYSHRRHEPVCLTFKPALIHCSESISQDERDGKGWRGYLWKICFLAFTWSPGETFSTIRHLTETHRHFYKTEDPHGTMLCVHNRRHVLSPRRTRTQKDGKKKYSRSFGSEQFYKASATSLRHQVHKLRYGQVLSFVKNLQRKFSK